ncbi:alpha/beta fold hydrolase [Streptomyces stramineus]
MADAHAGPGAARPAAYRPPERGPAPCARELTVRTDDGVTLHVEIDEAPGPVPTVLFVNGLNTALWYWQQQREHLTGLARLAFFDHRGHGRSGPATVSGATVARLARDLAAVIETVAPRGPVVLVGHSVGGMAITALAAQRPELFGPRVVGAALIDTLPGRSPTSPPAQGPGAGRRPAAVARARGAGRPRHRGVPAPADERGARRTGRTPAPAARPVHGRVPLLRDVRAPRRRRGVRLLRRSRRVRLRGHDGDRRGGRPLLPGAAQAAGRRPHPRGPAGHRAPGRPREPPARPAGGQRRAAGPGRARLGVPAERAVTARRCARRPSGAGNASAHSGVVSHPDNPKVRTVSHVLRIRLRTDRGRGERPVLHRPGPGTGAGRRGAGCAAGAAPPGAR